MESSNLLSKAQKFNQTEQPDAALKILKLLYQKDKTNRDVVLEVATAFQLQQKWDKARQLLKQLLKKDPRQADIWLKLSYLYIEQDLEKAVQVVVKGLGFCPQDIGLICQHAHLLAELGKIRTMVNVINQAIDEQPESQSLFLMERVAIFEQLALSPKKNQSTVKDAFGMTYATMPLEWALKDLETILTETPRDWRSLAKRAKIYKQLQNFERAQADYTAAIVNLDAEHRHMEVPLREQLRSCSSEGESMRHDFAESINENLASVADSEAALPVSKKRVNSPDATAEKTSQIKATEEKVAQEKVSQGKDPKVLLAEAGDDPDKQMALNIAQELASNAKEPAADYQPAVAEQYDSAAQRFCKKAEKKLVSFEFQTVGDFEPKGLSQQVGRQVLQRFLISQDQRVCAVAFLLKSEKPDLATSKRKRLFGQQKVAKVVELKTETANGEFLITNNTGDSEPFSSGEQIKIKSLPTNVGIDEIVEIHRHRIQAWETQGEQLLQSNSAEALVAMQERLRIAKNTYRQRVGLVTDGELKRLLGEQYTALASKVKYYLKQL